MQKIILRVPQQRMPERDFSGESEYTDLLSIKMISYMFGVDTSEIIKIEEQVGLTPVLKGGRIPSYHVSQFPLLIKGLKIIPNLHDDLKKQLSELDENSTIYSINLNDGSTLTYKSLADVSKDN